MKNIENSNTNKAIKNTSINQTSDENEKTIQFDKDWQQGLIEFIYNDYNAQELADKYHKIYEKNNKILYFSLIFIFVVLIIFIGLNYILFINKKPPNFYLNTQSGLVEPLVANESPYKLPLIPTEKQIKEYEINKINKSNQKINWFYGTRYPKDAKSIRHLKELNILNDDKNKNISNIVNQNQNISLKKNDENSVSQTISQKNNNSSNAVISNVKGQ